jgi:argonaute-like protein implicated in RNA metabolism and viral defense
MDICASVIHTDFALQAYELQTTSQGSRYIPRRDRAGRLSGYLRNVALNKILLTNERWPFVLASNLEADLTIGIDVKHNTVGFTLVSGRGHLIRVRLCTSHQKEKLLSQQVRKLLNEIVTEESRATFSAFGSIVIHRDGILFDSEQRAIMAALQDLRSSGVIRDDARFGMLEISKTAPAPLRLYDVTENDGRSWIQNPQIGTYYIMDGSNAFVCATGRAFFHEGTVNPLHVKYVGGTMPFLACLEDVYRLTCLAWARPEDCMRDPITIKLTDRRLGEDATPFDEDALAFEIPVGEGAVGL